MSRTALGFLLTPLLAGLLITLVRRPAPEMWSAVCLGVTFFAYLGTLAIAVPVFRWRRRIGRIALWMAPATGAVVGLATLLLLFGVVVAAFEGSIGDVMGALSVFYVLYATLCGAICGLAFWLIARPDRPATS